VKNRLPIPKILGGKWIVDLRPEFPGQWRCPLGPASMTEAEAIHAAYSKLAELRAGRAAEPHAQLELRPRGAAPRTFSDLLDRRLAARAFKTRGGENGARNIARALRADLGAYELEDFEGEKGDARLVAYRDSLSDLAARTVRWRFAEIRSCVELAARRGWMRVPPEFPEMPAIPRSGFEYIDEPTFRAVRAAVYQRTDRSVAAHSAGDSR